MPGLVNCHLRSSEPSLLEGSISSCPVPRGRGGSERRALGKLRALGTMQAAPSSGASPSSPPTKGFGRK